MIDTHTASRRPKVVGCILAGGRSSRMGGGDKGLRLLAGRPMIAHVIDRLAAEADVLIINANGDPSRFSSYGLPVVPDSLHDFPGPLAGVLAAMDYAAIRHPEADFIVTAAADTPFFPEGLAQSLLDAAFSARTVVIAASDDGTHPVFGLWPMALRAELKHFLDGGNRKVGAFVETRQHNTVHFPPLRVGDRTVDSFFNVNTPSELIEAEEIAKALAFQADLDRSRKTPLQQHGVVVGFAGWKNSGKTTLVTRLVADLTARGHTVATVKHAHHAFDIDHQGTDSFRHREAGATQTALVSARRVAIMQELAAPEDEPSLEAVLARLDPADIVLVEGWKTAAIPKVEVRRTAAARHDPLHPADPHVIAIAADHTVRASIPVFNLNEVEALASFLVTRKP